MSQYDRREIEKRAYAIWEHEGCPHGKDEEHWNRAVAELEREAAERSKAKSTARGSAKKAPAASKSAAQSSGKSAQSSSSTKTAQPKAATKSNENTARGAPKAAATRKKS